MFQICVLDQKVQGKELALYYRNYLNAMIRNIKIHNFFVIEVSKPMEPNNVFIKKYENIYLSVFYDLKKFNGSKKIKE
jgi:hypothetical protein